MGQCLLHVKFKNSRPSVEEGPRVNWWLIAMRHAYSLGQCGRSYRFNLTVCSYLGPDWLMCIKYLNEGIVPNLCMSGSSYLGDVGIFQEYNHFVLISLTCYTQLIWTDILYKWDELLHATQIFFTAGHLHQQLLGQFTLWLFYYLFCFYMYMKASD